MLTNGLWSLPVCIYSLWLNTYIYHRLNLSMITHSDIERCSSFNNKNAKKYNRYLCYCFCIWLPHFIRIPLLGALFTTNYLLSDIVNRWKFYINCIPLTLRLRLQIGPWFRKPVFIFFQWTPVFPKNWKINHTKHLLGWFTFISLYFHIFGSVWT